MSEQPVLRCIHSVEAETGQERHTPHKVDAGVGHLLKRVVADIMGAVLENAEEVVLHYLEEVAQIGHGNREECLPALVFCGCNEQPGNSEKCGCQEHPAENEMHQPEPAYIKRVAGWTGIGNVTASDKPAGQ